MQAWWRSYKNRRIASNIRSYVQGGFTTQTEHMPKSHQRYLEWTPSRIISWAGKTGPNTAALVEKILASRPHPEQGYRSCLGIIRLADKFSDERVEAASGRALRCNAISYKSVLIVSQMPVENWYDIISAPTIADAILDRLVHNSYRIEMTGESMRRKLSPLSPSDSGGDL